MTTYRSLGRPADRYQNNLATPWEREYHDVGYVPALSGSLPEDDWAAQTGLVNHAATIYFSGLYSHQPHAWDAPTMVDAANCDFVRYRRLPIDHFFADSFRFGTCTVSSK
jgi:hypothetical protein